MRNSVAAVLLLGAGIGAAWPSPANGAWYYCDPARGYYPTVQTCPVPWREVTPTEPQVREDAQADEMYRPRPGETYSPDTYCDWNRTGLPARQQKICLDRDRANPPKLYQAKPGEALMKLLPHCDPGGAVSCNNDVFQQVWKRFEADNGEAIYVDMNSVSHPNGGMIWATVYINVPGAMFDPSRLNNLGFDCAGHYQNMSGEFPFPVLDAPPRSVAGRIASIVCTRTSAVVPETGPTATTLAVASRPSWTDVVLRFQSVSDAEGTTVSGTTNLPSGTHLTVVLRYPMNSPEGRIYRFPESQVIVEAGRFRTEKLSDNGRALPGSVGKLEIWGLDPTLESAGVQAIIGKEGEKMHGPLVELCGSTLPDKCVHLAQDIRLDQNDGGGSP